MRLWPYQREIADAISDPAIERVTLVKPVRVGLWDRYGGSMPSGWTRWLLERFEFPFQIVFAPELDSLGTKQNPGVRTFPHLSSSSSLDNLRELRWSVQIGT